MRPLGDFPTLFLFMWLIFSGILSLPLCCSMLRHICTIMLSAGCKFDKNMLYFGNVACICDVISLLCHDAGFWLVGLFVFLLCGIFAHFCRVGKLFYFFFVSVHSVLVICC